MVAAAVPLIAALRDSVPDSCQRDLEARRWRLAALTCQRDSVQLRDPARGVDAAEALFQDGQRDTALAVATRWFDSTADAAARRVAGMVHLVRSENAAAQHLFERALALHRRAGDHAQASRDAQLLSGALLYQELFREALDAAEVAAVEADRAGAAQLAVYASLALGKILAEIGDAARARTALWHARERATDPADRAWIYLQLGMLESDTGHAAEGAKLIALALEIARTRRISRTVGAALLNLARVERELGQLEAAEAHMRALDPEQRDMPTARFVAGLIAADRGERWVADRLLALASAEAPTDDYAIDMAVQRGKFAERAGDDKRAEDFYREAIGVLHRLQAGNSLELRPWVLAQRRAANGALIALLARADRRDAALTIAAQLHARTWQDALLGHAGPADSTARVAAAHTLHQGARNAADPDATGQPVQVLLARSDVLIFSDTGVDVWRFYLVDGRIERLDRVAPEVVELVEQWRIRPDDMGLAARLGPLVPAEAYRPSTRPLSIIADGRLVALPFAALRHEDRFLIEGRVLIREPDIVALRCGSAEPAPHTALFLGDSRNDLGFARAEVGRLAELLGGDAFVGDQVTVERLRAGRDVSLLHLALHADENATGPTLRLARDSVSSADIVAMKLAPRLAVLAGCATAASRDLEGWDALSSAFLVNGTRTVVATLQPVRDGDAAALLHRFYELGGEQHPARALALAQRERLSSAISTWAPYATYGAADAECAPEAP